MVYDEEENFHNLDSSNLQDELVAPKLVSLFLPQHVFLGTFLGGALAGFTLLAYNYKKLNSTREFKICLVAALVVVPSLLSLILLLPDSRWDKAWPVGIAIAMAMAATYIQDVRRLASSKNMVVEAKSIWLAVAVGMLCLLFQFALVIAFMKLF